MKKEVNSNSPKVSIILPTYNEEKSISKIIREIKTLKKKFTFEIIVADGGSKDKTVLLAKKENVRVIQFPVKRGKGVDFWEAGLQAKGEYIVQIDADYQFRPSEIPLLVTALDKGADIAIGKRIDQGDAPLIRTLGNFLLTMATSVAAGRRISDSLAGFKAIKRNKFKRLNLTERHFGYEAETVIKSVRLKYKLVEVPVSYTRRNTGISQVSPLRDGLLILGSILKARFTKLR
jgi:glycosyltransferase involved in cell wall biosynthesis